MNKPVVWVDKIWIDRPDLVQTQRLDIGQLFMRSGEGVKNYIPLYTHPVKELTDEEMIAVCKNEGFAGDLSLLIEFAKAILRKAQEK